MKPTHIPFVILMFVLGFCTPKKKYPADGQGLSLKPDVPADTVECDGSCEPEADSLAWERLGQPVP